jgi:hypothetical protein
MVAVTICNRVTVISIDLSLMLACVHILLTCWKHLYDSIFSFIKRKVCSHQTSLLHFFYWSSCIKPGKWVWSSCIKPGKWAWSKLVWWEQTFLFMKEKMLSYKCFQHVSKMWTQASTCCCKEYWSLCIINIHSIKESLTLRSSLQVFRLFTKLPSSEY